MKKLFIMASAILIASFSISAETYQYEPVDNKAEYYSGKFNDGKGMQDLVKWGNKWAKWTEGREDWDSMQTVIFTPYYHNDITAQDYVWLNISPSSTVQYKAIDSWVRDGGKLLSSLPVTNQRVVEAWQWPISIPEGDNTETGYVRFTDCTLKEGVTTRKAFDVYKNFAMKARSTGDDMGRKMIFPASGIGNVDFDYVYSLYGTSPTQYGKDIDNFDANLEGTDEVKALNEISECTNARSYTTLEIKSPS